MRREHWKRIERSRRRRELLGGSVDADTRSPAALGGAKKRERWVGWFGVVALCGELCEDIVHSFRSINWTSAHHRPVSHMGSLGPDLISSG